MSIQSEISRITTAKLNIKTSIEGKGVTVPSSAKISDYSALIDSIQEKTNTVYTGTTVPADRLGNNGDIYIKL